MKTQILLYLNVISKMQEDEEKGLFISAFMK